MRNLRPRWAVPLAVAFSIGGLGAGSALAVAQSSGSSATPSSSQTATGGNGGNGGSGTVNQNGGSGFATGGAGGSNNGNTGGNGGNAGSCGGGGGGGAGVAGGGGGGGGGGCITNNVSPTRTIVVQGHTVTTSSSQGREEQHFVPRHVVTERQVQVVHQAAPAHVVVRQAAFGG